jgi:hypothetical protein
VHETLMGLGRPRLSPRMTEMPFITLLLPALCDTLRTRRGFNYARTVLRQGDTQRLLKADWLEGYSSLVDDALAAAVVIEPCTCPCWW